MAFIHKNTYNEGMYQIQGRTKMRSITNITFLNFIKLLVVGVFLPTSGVYACVDLDLFNGTDKPAVIKSFSRNYSDLMITSDMAIDPTEKLDLEIFIQYKDLFKYQETLKAKGSTVFSDGKQDYMEFAIGDDDFVIFWDPNLNAFLKKNHNDTYDVVLESLSTDNPSKKMYKVLLNKKS